MNPAPEDRLIGEYRLKQLLNESSRCRTWLAEQVSVARRVLVDELLDLSQRDAFLADVRAKAAVEHPLVGSVYEAVSEPDLCFYAHELLPGVTLDERKNASLPLVPARFNLVLRRVADANLQYEALSHATSLLGLDAIHLDEHDVVRLKNLAVTGARTPDQSVRDIVNLGSALVPLIADGKPGTTRLLTLASWMRGEGLESPLSWRQIHEFCDQIEQQLADPLPPPTVTQRITRAEGKKLPVGLIAAATGIVIMAIIAMAVHVRPPKLSAPARVSLPGPVLISAGNYPTPDGIVEKLPAFEIASHETTIGQYAEFLETLDFLAKEHHETIYDHENQPINKTSHVPDSWAELFPIAKTSGTWQGRAITLDCPITGVDWWDASAYADWKKARLPTQEEWFAALMQDITTPSSLVPGAFAPVTAKTIDRTPNGLIGMAGSVCEWTRHRSPNPANPLGESLWVIVGGSYLKPGSNALSREWTNDRSLRRTDLGFRVAFDVK